MNGDDKKNCWKMLDNGSLDLCYWPFIVML